MRNLLRLGRFVPVFISQTIASPAAYPTEPYLPPTFSAILLHTQIDVAGLQENLNKSNIYSYAPSVVVLNDMRACQKRFFQ